MKRSHLQSMNESWDFMKSNINFIRSIRNKYNIPNSIKLNLSIDLLGKDVDLYDIYIYNIMNCIVNMNGININSIDYDLFSLFERDKFFEYINIQGYNIYLELPNVDKKSQEESINKEILRLSNQLQKYKSNLQNESFINNAKQEVIENMKQKFNDTNNNIQSLNANLLMLSNGKLYYDLLTKFGNNEKLKWNLEHFREYHSIKESYSKDWFDEIYNDTITKEEIEEFHYQQFKGNKDYYNIEVKNWEDICYVNDDGNLTYLQ